MSMNTYRDRVIVQAIVYRALMALGIVTILGVPTFGLMRAVIFSCLLVGALTLILLLFIYVDYLSLRELFNKYHVRDYSIKQTREIRVRAPMDKAYEYALLNIQNIKGIKDVRGLKNSWTIEAKTKMSWKSYGERIVLAFSQGLHDNTVIHISSEPVNRRTYMDCGKNYENAEQLQRLLIGMNRTDGS